MIDFNVEKSQSKNAKGKRLHELLESVTKWRWFLKLSFNIIRFFCRHFKAYTWYSGPHNYVALTLKKFPMLV